MSAKMKSSHRVIGLLILLLQYENPQTDQRSRKRLHSPSTQPEESSKRARILGGRPATNKKVTADYDTDDNRIRELKHQGYTNQQVVTKLIDEGRVRYVPAPVASRWMRIRKIDEKKEDDRLDDELSDWHVGEVSMLHPRFEEYLMTAYRTANSKRASKP